MDQVTEGDVCAAIARVLPGHRLVRWHLLGTGVSAQVVGVETQFSADVVHRHALRMEQDDGAAVDAIIDHGLLNYLYTQGLPVPRCSATTQVDDYHVTVMDWIAGEAGEKVADVAGAAIAAADVLFELHQTSLHDLSLHVSDPLPHYVFDYSMIPLERLNSSEFEKFAEFAQSYQPKEQCRALLHGDFWPGNLLYENEHLSGLVDWRDACIGDPLADLANARYEIAWLWGEVAMDAFTERYWMCADQDHRYVRAPDEAGYRAAIPAWDLHAVLKPLRRMHLWGLNEVELKDLRATVDGIVQRATIALAGL